MNDTLTDLIRRLRALEDEIEAEAARRREQAGYLLRHRVRFEKATVAAHRAMRRSVGRFLRESGALKTIAAPLVYTLIAPLVLLDITVALFQAVCFPVYGIRKVPRGDFIAVDRHHLAYLNPLEKLNCVYCGYANGVLAWAREIASRSEEHWCPIKHARKVRGTTRRYLGFHEYGDAEAYRRSVAGNDNATGG